MYIQLLELLLWARKFCMSITVSRGIFLLVKLLLDHIWKGHDFQIRAHWEPNTVVIFDNRVVGHTAILDFDTTDSRLIIRASARVRDQFLT